MTKRDIKSIIELVSQGWRAYEAMPQSLIYEKLGCDFAPELDGNGRPKRKRKAPFWFVRGEHFVCIGCDRCCSLFRPEGFIMPLPINYDRKTGEPFTLTPAEMVQRKSLLRVDETAYCLNISERKVYDWIAEGRLRRTEDLPVRIPVEDVKERMNLFLD